MGGGHTATAQTDISGSKTGSTKSADATAGSKEDNKSSLTLIISNLAPIIGAIAALIAAFAAFIAKRSKDAIEKVLEDRRIFEIHMGEILGKPGSEIWERIFERLETLEGQSRLKEILALESSLEEVRSTAEGTVKHLKDNREWFAAGMMTVLSRRRESAEVWNAIYTGLKSGKGKEAVWEIVSSRLNSADGDKIIFGRLESDLGRKRLLASIIRGMKLEEDQCREMAKELLECMILVEELLKQLALDPDSTRKLAGLIQDPNITGNESEAIESLKEYMRWLETRS